VASTSITVAAIGTNLFMPPEVIQGKPHSKKSDIFSLGILMWMLITKKTDPKDVYPDITGEDVLQAVSNGARPHITKDFQSSYANIMERCWHQEEEKRPSIEEILLFVNSKFNAEEKPSGISFVSCMYCK
jgi:serine/threonine protein kinase